MAKTFICRKYIYINIVFGHFLYILKYIWKYIFVSYGLERMFMRMPILTERL